MNASLVNGITVNLITPSGPKCKEWERYGGGEKNKETRRDATMLWN